MKKKLGILDKANLLTYDVNEVLGESTNDYLHLLKTSNKELEARFKGDYDKVEEIQRKQLPKRLLRNTVSGGVVGSLVSKKLGKSKIAGAAIGATLGAGTTGIRYLGNPVKNKVTRLTDDKFIIGKHIVTVGNHAKEKHLDMILVARGKMSKEKFINKWGE